MTELQIIFHIKRILSCWSSLKSAWWQFYWRYSLFTFMVWLFTNQTILWIVFSCVWIRNIFAYISFSWMDPLSPVSFSIPCHFICAVGVMKLLFCRVQKTPIDQNFERPRITFSIPLCNSIFSQQNDDNLVLHLLPSLSYILTIELHESGWCGAFTFLILILYMYTVYTWHVCLFLHMAFVFTVIFLTFVFLSFFFFLCQL